MHKQTHHTIHKHPSVSFRFFLTRVNLDCEADICIEALDPDQWQRVPTTRVTDLPVMHGMQSEVDLLSGRTASYEVEVYLNSNYFNS